MSRPSPSRTTLMCSFACLALILVLAIRAVAHGDFEERIRAANRAVEATPSNPEPRLIRAELHRRHGNFAAALKDLDDASQLSPVPDRLDYLRAQIYLDSDRHAAAESLLRDFLKRHPEHPAAHEAYARALLQLERPLAAARAYDLAIALKPVPSPDAFIERARALAAAGHLHLEEAIRGIDAGIALIGPVLTLEQVAIDLELRLGAIDAALARLEVIQARSTRRETWLAQRGRILAQAGRSEEARQSFSLALTALEQLPLRRRRTAATLRLESNIKADMARLLPSQTKSAR